MNYDVVIGLETHVELGTKTKMFCSCKNEFGGAPNTHCCEVCTAMPGALPVINSEAVKSTIKAGLATNCKISNEFYFDRKNYFYPDLSKAYQISQLYVPICQNGKVEIETEKGKKTIRLNRIHLEEDAGKLVHGAYGETMVDFNRGGVPLIECVTEPDFSNAAEVMAYLETIKETFKTLGISECRMERGQLRCDVNISLKPAGSDKLGTRTEMKNLNSFSAIERAIKFEVNRQTKELEKGNKIVQETLRWDDEKGTNYPMRSKEDAHDYRYFPEPDLLPVRVTNEEIEKIRSELPMLPKQKREKYTKEYGLTDYDASQLTRDKTISDFFDESIKMGANPKIASNWIQGEISKYIREEIQQDIFIPVSAKSFAKVLEMHISGKISQASARELLKTLWTKDEDPEKLVEKLGLASVSDSGEIEKVVKAIIDENPNAVNDYKSGKGKALAFFVGQAMKATKGKANAEVVNTIVKKLLD